MEDIITLENSLTETIAEKEALTRSNLNIDDRASYSSFTISINEVGVVGDRQEPIELSFGTRLANALADSWFNFTRSLQNIIISLVYSLPALAFLAFIIFIIYIIREKFPKKFLKEKTSLKSRGFFSRKKESKDEKQDEENPNNL